MGKYKCYAISLGVRIAAAKTSTCIRTCKIIDCSGQIYLEIINGLHRNSRRVRAVISILLDLIFSINCPHVLTESIECKYPEYNDK